MQSHSLSSGRSVALADTSTLISFAEADHYTFLAEQFGRYLRITDVVAGEISGLCQNPELGPVAKKIDRLVRARVFGDPLPSLDPQEQVLARSLQLHFKQATPRSSHYGESASIARAFLYPDAWFGFIAEDRDALKASLEFGLPTLNARKALLAWVKGGGDPKIGLDVFNAVSTVNHISEISEEAFALHVEHSELRLQEAGWVGQSRTRARGIPDQTLRGWRWLLPPSTTQQQVMAESTSGVTELNDAQRRRVEMIMSTHLETTQAGNTRLIPIPGVRNMSYTFIPTNPSVVLLTRVAGSRLYAAGVVLVSDMRTTAKAMRRIAKAALEQPLPPARPLRPQVASRPQSVATTVAAKPDPQIVTAPPVPAAVAAAEPISPEREEVLSPVSQIQVTTVDASDYSNPPITTKPDRLSPSYTPVAEREERKSWLQEHADQLRSWGITDTGELNRRLTAIGLMELANAPAGEKPLAVSEIADRSSLAKLKPDAALNAAIDRTVDLLRSTGVHTANIGRVTTWALHHGFEIVKGNPDQLEALLGTFPAADLEQFAGETTALVSVAKTKGALHSDIPTEAVELPEIVFDAVPELEEIVAASAPLAPLLREVLGSDELELRTAAERLLDERAAVFSALVATPHPSAPSPEKLQKYSQILETQLDEAMEPGEKMTAGDYSTVAELAGRLAWTERLQADWVAAGNIPRGVGRAAVLQAAVEIAALSERDSPSDSPEADIAEALQAANQQDASPELTMLASSYAERARATESSGAGLA